MLPVIQDNRAIVLSLEQSSIGAVFGMVEMAQWLLYSVEYVA